MKRTILLLFVLFGFYQFISAQTTCSFVENDFYTYDEVLQCFKSIPLDYQVKTQTLETMKRSLEVYAFYDIAHDSPDPNLPLKVNMQKGLQEIYDRPYVFDLDFQEDLRYLYIQLNDAHTQYYLPACYQNILIRQGFAPIGSGSTVENFNITIAPYITEDLLNYYQGLNIDLAQYIGAQILYINGIPSYDYFLTYANHSVGISKEFGTRFNYALTIVEPRDDISIIQYGYWQQRTHRNPFPETPTITYTINLRGTVMNVTLPWSFMALKTYTGVDSFMDDYWATYANPSSSPDERDHKLRRHFETLKAKSQEWKENPYAPTVTHSFMSLAPSVKPLISQYKNELLEQYKKSNPQFAEYTFELLANSSHLTFWALSDNKTLVMYLDTMEPGRFSDYYPTLVKGFNVAAQRGLSRFIIDLTNNGGGNICLGQSLLAFLQQSGWKGEGQNWGPQDLPLSTLAEQLVHSAVEHNVSDTVWSPGFYDNQQDQHIANNDTSYILPGVPHERADLLRNYSKLLHINECGDFGYYIEPKVNFPPEQVMIITKGFCGSTCALFANHLSLYDNIQTVVVGGIPGSDQMQYTSFPGLQVLDDGPLFGMFLELRQNITACPVNENKGDPVPRLLLTQATFRYCIREIYPPVPNYDQPPMEFTFQPATHHIFFTELTAVFPQYIWYEVLDYFPASL